MRIIVITNTGLKRFCQVGGDDPNSPRVSLAYPFNGYLKEKGISVEIFSLKNRIVDSENIGQDLSLISYFKIIPFAKYFASFDFIVTLGAMGPYLATILTPLLANKKVFTVVFANSPPPSEGILGKIKNLVFQTGLRTCGGLIYMTQEQMNYAIENFKLPLEKVHHLPLGVDTKFFVPLSSCVDVMVRKELLDLPLKKYVVAAGDQLRDEHQIAKIMKETELKLVRLTQSDRIEKFWEKFNQTNSGQADVFCKARLDFQEVRYVYQHALCVLNLVDNSWQPAGWTVATEAMACGIPVVMNSGLVTRELKRYQDPPPLLEISSTPEIGEVRKELKKLSADFTFAKNLGQSGRKYIEDNLQIEKTGEILINILHKHLK